MAGTTGGSVDESCSTANEGVVASSSDDHETFTALHGRRSITSIALVLINSQRFASDGRLINLKIAFVGDKPAISWDNASIFNLENVARHNHGSFDFDQLAVSKDNCFQGQSLLELFNNRPS